MASSVANAVASAAITVSSIRSAGLAGRRAPGVGMSWHARFSYRGKQRKVDLSLTEMAAPGAVGFYLVSPAVEATTRIELMEMSAKRTRMHVTTEIKPRSLGARLFLQSLRLARQMHTVNVALGLPD